MKKRLYVLAALLLLLAVFLGWYLLYGRQTKKNYEEGTLARTVERRVGA